MFDLEGLGSIRQTYLENSWVWLPPLPAERSEWEIGDWGESVRSWELAKCEEAQDRALGSKSI